MHMMSKLKNTAAALALCAALSAPVGLRVSEMRPDGCPRRARAACTMRARDGCVQTEWVAALRCTSIGRICALAVTVSAGTASLGPIGLSASASVERGRGGYRWEGAGHSGAGLAVRSADGVSQGWPRGNRHPRIAAQMAMGCARSRHALLRSVGHPRRSRTETTPMD
ncbi:hypothetical protein T492DRAFT_1104919 [Pavlovales sp. CCMP2436]|nr:hypothetical protein T492DRAFT_1104919 [Pavlovales sp. CCMP2436]